MKVFVGIVLLSLVAMATAMSLPYNGYVNPWDQDPYYNRYPNNWQDPYYNGYPYPNGYPGYPNNWDINPYMDNGYLNPSPYITPNPYIDNGYLNPNPYLNPINGPLY